MTNTSTTGEAIIAHHLSMQVAAIARDLAIIQTALYRHDYYTAREALERINSISLTAYSRANTLTEAALPLTLPMPKDTYGPRPSLESLQALEDRN